MSPLLALCGHQDRAAECPLSGVKQTSKFKSVTQAQQSGAVRRIGILMAYAENDPETGPHRIFPTGVARAGLEARRKFQIEYRWAAGDKQRTQELARDIVGLQPDLIVANNHACYGCAATRDEDYPYRLRDRFRSSRRWTCRKYRDVRVESEIGIKAVVITRKSNFTLLLSQSFHGHWHSVPWPQSDETLRFDGMASLET